MTQIPSVPFDCRLPESVFDRIPSYADSQTSAFALNPSNFLQRHSDYPAILSENLAFPKADIQRVREKLTWAALTASPPSINHTSMSGCVLDQRQLQLSSVQVDAVEAKSRAERAWSFADFMLLYSGEKDNRGIYFKSYRIQEYFSPIGDPRFVEGVNLKALDNAERRYAMQSLLIGTKFSWTSAHDDWLAASAWLWVIEGVKIVLLCPPEQKTWYTETYMNERKQQGFPTRYTSAELLEFRKRNCIFVRVCGGDVLWIPSGWVHAAKNVSDVPTVTVGDSVFLDVPVHRDRSRKVWEEMGKDGRRAFSELICPKSVLLRSASFSASQATPSPVLGKRARAIGNGTKL